ncbi:metallophosphoesterase family protein [Plastoroseomonas hellenica]|uniref:Metallophosphoesterase n=1 Tax=Plastoroseomonas hellenica TaxID=2687306 RepID=A0ABS5EWP3_9PROT|nr:metallophosphoesterase [Plastoroseomonas hellenica]MBR0641250.1 metallophosphoesterase [Plastoroseomonas hellenica]MBR0664719.1 metallophosphoesterase [Plastoroseomonas hellenica]
MTTAPRIALVSDIHLSRARPYFHANWEILLQELVQEAPDLVLLAGDIALDAPHREEDLAFARAQLDRLPAPWRAVPGNHDVGNNIPDLRGEATVTEARRAAWLRHFDEDFWALDIGGWRIVGLDCLICGSGFAAEAEQAAFLERAVAEAAQRKVALLYHKPLCAFELLDTEVSQSFWYPEVRETVLRLMRDGVVRLCMSGHLHESRDRLIAGVRHVWAPGIAFVQDIAGEWLPERHGRRRVGYMMLELAEEPRVTLREPSRMLNIDIGNWLRSGSIGHYGTLAGSAPYLGLLGRQD